MNMSMKNTASSLTLLFCVVLSFNFSPVVECVFDRCQPPLALDIDVVKFASNFKYLESEFYLHSSIGRGLDSIYPDLAFGGPPPIGAQMANLDPLLRGIMEEFGYQVLGNLRVVSEEVGGQGIKRPLLNLSKDTFSDLVDKAFGFPLDPPFDPYVNTINFLLATTLFPYTGQLGLVGVAPQLLLLRSRKLTTKFLGITAGQNAVIRTFLYQRMNETVAPYNVTVAEFVEKIAMLTNRLGKCGNKDEGLVVPLSLGAENRTMSNILAADANSLSYSRTLQEILRIMYGSGDEGVPGALFPEGANGFIAQRFRRHFI